MKIIITGANGFVGAVFCRYFHNNGHEIIATGRQITPSGELLKYATYKSYDIINPIEYFNADVCIHVAGLASDKAGYDDLFLNNVTGTKNVLRAAKNCKYFIFISSSSVYDFTDKPAIEIDVNLNNKLSDYGRTKLMAEKLVKENIPVHQQRLILRPRAIYGIGDRLLLSRVLKLIKFKTIFYPATNNLQTSATHVFNIADAIGLFFNQQNKPPLQVFNVADDEVYSLKEIALKMINVAEGQPLKVFTIPTGVLRALAYTNPGQVSPLALKTFTQNSVLALDNIKKTLHYKPLHNFDNSVAGIGKWITSIGGKKVYLDNLDNVPWMLNGEK